MSNTAKTTESIKQTAEITQITPPRANCGNRNALVHGVYASEIVLSFESAEDFERLHADLREEFYPNGRQEEETVLSIARCNWLRHRLMRAQRMVFRRNALVAELEKSGVKSWADVENFVHQKGTAASDIMTEVKKTLQDLQAATKSASARMKATDTDTHEIFREVETMEQMFNLLMPVYQRVYDENPKKPAGNASSADASTPNAIDHAYHPDHLEKLVKLEASIDARIDKLLQRLVSLKEYKRLARESAKTISNSSIELPPVTDGTV
jgi:hypothetical protein